MFKYKLGSIDMPILEGYPLLSPYSKVPGFWRMTVMSQAQNETFLKHSNLLKKSYSFFHS